MEDRKKVKKPRGVARLIPGKCIACGARCQSSCPKDAIEMNDQGEPIITAAKCIGCRKCLKVCPSDALEIYLTPEEQKILAELAAQQKAPAAEEAPEATEEEAALLARLKEYRGVLVFVEQTAGEPAGVSWELLFMLCVLTLFIIKHRRELQALPVFKINLINWLQSRRRET